jgi:hypothetical protein
MKVIQTHYEGVFFRSRTEARYAKFFDCLKLQWVYEGEGYDLDGDRYLPDFWMPSLECFIEIKGKFPNRREVRVARKLQFFTERDVVICHGLPMENDAIKFGWDHENGGSFTETFCQWDIDDGLVTFNEFPNESPRLIEAARCARAERFEYGRPQKQVVNYDSLPF